MYTDTNLDFENEAAPSVISLWVTIIATAAPKPTFPLKTSENHRYLVDSANTPFFIHSELPWELFWLLTREEAIELLDNRATKGFNTLLLDVPLTCCKSTIYNLHPPDTVKISDTFSAYISAYAPCMHLTRCK